MNGDLLIGHVKSSLRYLARNKTFAVVIAGTLAIGFGANVAVFAVIQAVLLRPLPFTEPDRLVALWASNLDQGGTQEPVKERTLEDWMTQAKAFSSITGYRYDGLTLLENGEPIEVLTAEVSPSFFTTLGVQPHRGRPFIEREALPGNEKVLLISYGLWQTRFGREPSVVGRRLDMGDESYTVIGVMPRGFRFPSKEVEFWAPLVIDPAAVESKARNILVVARLAPGVTLKAARADLDSLSDRLATEAAEIYEGWGAQIVTLREQIVGDWRPILFLLAGAVIAMFLICCVSVAILLLSRATSSQGELAIRAALGASKRSIMAQFLIECLLLALLGAAGGVLLANSAIGWLLPLAPAEAAPANEITIDLWVIVFAIGLALVAGLFIGLPMALRLGRFDLMSPLKATSVKPGGSSRGSLRRSLIVVEVALTLSLLIGAGLMVRTIISLYRANPGWNPENLLAAQLYLPASRYSQPHEIRALIDSLLDAVRSSPGVISAGGTTALPGLDLGIDFAIPVLSPGEPGQDRTASFREVTPGYFETMGIPVIEGRGFDISDADPQLSTLIVNQAFARRFFPDEASVVGKRTVLPYHGPKEYEIVGVVGNVHHDGLDSEPHPEFYLPFQRNPYQSLGIVVRTAGDPLEYLPVFRARLWALDPEQPISFSDSMINALAESFKTRRFVMSLLGVFAAVALLLTATGIYGVMSFIVHQKVPEIGIRMALGASTRQIFRSVVGEALVLAFAGLAIGLVSAVIASRWLSSLLYGVSPNDPLVISLGVLMVGIVALFGAYWPARTAMHVDPLIAMRNE